MTQKQVSKGKMRTVNAEVQTYKFQIKLVEHMKQTIRTSDNYYGCTLRAAKDFQFETQVHCNYEEETVRYAVCRYIRHCPKIRDRFIREAVKLGLSTGKKTQETSDSCQCQKYGTPGP